MAVDPCPANVFFLAPAGLGDSSYCARPLQVARSPRNHKTNYTKHETFQLQINTRPPTFSRDSGGLPDPPWTCRNVVGLTTFVLEPTGQQPWHAMRGGAWHLKLLDTKHRRPRKTNSGLPSPPRAWQTSRASMTGTRASAEPTQMGKHPSKSRLMLSFWGEHLKHYAPYFDFESKGSNITSAAFTWHIGFATVRGPQSPSTPNLRQILLGRAHRSIRTNALFTQSAAESLIARPCKQDLHQILAKPRLGAVPIADSSTVTTIGTLYSHTRYE